MASRQDSLQLMLSCVVCLEEIEDSGGHMPCTHTLCEACVKQLICNQKLECPENNLIAENLNEVYWHILFSQSFEELAKRSQNMSCEQCEVSKCLAYRHILKSVVKKLKEKNQKFSFSKLDLSLSVHMQSAVLLPPGSGS